MNGKMIVIDGLDGSGKATQTKLLKDYFIQKGILIKSVTFPDYQSDSSALVKMYLNGDINSDPGAVNAYAASTFYSADRYISYSTFWHKNYENGEIILSDRYVSSNIIHQMVKLNKAAWDEYINWLYDFEFEKLCLPKPDVLIYLDMPPAVSEKLIMDRYQGDACKKDIHERDSSYLHACRKAALYAANKLKWHVIRCGDEGTQSPFPIDMIHEEILSAVKKIKLL